jgi:hypothetical protein
MVGLLLRGSANCGPAWRKSYRTEHGDHVSSTSKGGSGSYAFWVAKERSVSRAAFTSSTYLSNCHPKENLGLLTGRHRIVSGR